MVMKTKKMVMVLLEMMKELLMVVLMMKVNV